MGWMIEAKSKREGASEGGMGSLKVAGEMNRYGRSKQAGAAALRNSVVRGESITTACTERPSIIAAALHPRYPVDPKCPAVHVS